MLFRSEADAALLALANETRNRDERRTYEEAREAAMTQRDVIENHFRKRYFDDFQRRSDRARRIGDISAHSGLSMADLEIVGDDDLDETLRFNDMANKLRAYCEDELVALDQRVGVLLGDADLQAKDNPFSPQVICDAFKHA